MLTGGEIVAQTDAMKADRLPVESTWRDCFAYTWPIRGLALFQGDASASHSGADLAKSLQAKMFDSTAPDAGRTLASHLVAGTTPSNSKWFGLKVADDETTAEEINKFLDDACSVVHSDIHASNFDAPAFEAMLDLIPAGQFALYVEEGDEDPYNFELWPITSCYFGCSKKSGRVDIVHYCYSLTALQIKNEFGEEQLTDGMKETLQKDPKKTFPFVHAIYPKVMGKRPKKKDLLQPFASCHVHTESKTIFREGSYHEFPVMAPRWHKIPGSNYAVGPMNEALPDAQTLNEAKRITLANGDIQTAGMWGAVDDGVLNPKTVRIGARKIIFMKSKDSFFPLNPPGKPDLAALMISDLKQSIRRILMANQLEASHDGPAKTATEVHYLVNLLRQLLGPMYGRLQSEYLQPLVIRCLGIALRKGRLKDIPPALQGKNLRLRYISPLARAQQMEDVQAMDRMETDLLEKSKVKPDLADNYDWDEAARTKATLLGVPTQLMFSAEKVNKLREDRSAAQRQHEIQLAQAQNAGKQQPGMMGGEAARPGMEGMAANG